jgi:hypothetical protein
MSELAIDRLDLSLVKPALLRNAIAVVIRTLDQKLTIALDRTHANLDHDAGDYRTGNFGDLVANFEGGFRHDVSPYREAV